MKSSNYTVNTTELDRQREQRRQEIRADLAAWEEANYSACPHCGARLVKARSQKHVNKCKKKQAYEKDWVEGTTAWMASAKVICHYLADCSNTKFVCGVKVGKHQKVDDAKYTQCAECCKVLGIPSKVGKRRRPPKSPRLKVFQGAALSPTGVDISSC